MLVKAKLQGILSTQWAHSGSRAGLSTPFKHDLTSSEKQTVTFLECKYTKHIFELRMKDQIEERSSQLLRNLSSCEKKA